MKKILYSCAFLFLLTSLVKCEAFRSPYGRLEPVYTTEVKIFTSPYKTTKTSLREKKRIDKVKPKQLTSKPQKPLVANNPKPERKKRIDNTKKKNLKSIEQIINEEQAKEADFLLTKKETEKRIKELDRLIEIDKRNEFLNKITFGIYPY